MEGLAVTRRVPEQSFRAGMRLPVTARPDFRDAGRGANVIGGSDDPADRIAPDGVRAVRKGERTMLLNTLRSQTRATRAKLPR